MKRRQEDWFGPHELYLGVDAGKSFRWAVGPGQEGEIRISRRVEDRLDDAGALPGEAGDAALVVADQKNSIGSLVVRRCRAKGIDAGYLPGKSMKSAREMLPGTAKNDRIDAEAIAQAGMSLRRAVLPIADTDDLGASMSLLSSQPAYAARRATMARNRLHAVLPESDPAFEAAADLSAAWTLDVLAAFGGAAGIAAAGRRSYGAACARSGATKEARDAFWNAACASAGSCSHPASEDLVVRELADGIARTGRSSPSSPPGLRACFRRTRPISACSRFRASGQRPPRPWWLRWTSASSGAAAGLRHTAAWRRRTETPAPRRAR